jgi:hypothetical protein
MRTSGNGAYVVGDDSDFQQKVPGNGVIKLYKQGGALSFSEVDDESSAMRKLDTTLEFNETVNFFQGNWVIKVPHLYELKVDPVSGHKSYEDKGPSPTQAPEINAAFRPTNADGSGDGGLNVDVLRNGGTVQVSPYMTITARIRSNGKVVDMAPASFYDDRQLNGVNNDPAIANINGGNSQRPVLTLVSQNGSPISFGESFFEGGQAVNFVLKFKGGESIICPDPRWNFAPENYYVMNEALSGGNWFSEKCGVGQNSRDGDIFMYVGNQGYLQSISEIANLPRTAVDMGGGDAMLGNCQVSFGRNSFEVYPGPNDPFTALAHGQFMWRTYRLYDQGGLADDGIYDMGIVSEGSGFRVNPFTSSRDIMMAAIANTPYSWWAASTNNQDKAMEELDAPSFNREYAFSEMNSDAKFAWKDLEKVAGNLIANMRRDDGNWQLGFSNLDWAGNNSDFCGVDFENTDADELKEVDRKFLYGFWRDSFAAKQQLFLVFVRAEPLMMGGGASGQTPPQLGARAVALVWRDPTPSREDVSGQPRPHRTRVLFYRQFD